ncbi:hypothetical protein [Halalkalibacter oceani]|uniref:hypothetical protein n=1 Tax=Halalkalibacter oceani TaxID=1653776 RepID=UPI0033926A9A
MVTKTNYRKVAVRVPKRRTRKTRKARNLFDSSATSKLSPVEFARRRNLITARRLSASAYTASLKKHDPDTLKVGKDGVAQIDFNNPAHLGWLDD